MTNTHLLTIRGIPLDARAHRAETIWFSFGLQMGIPLDARAHRAALARRERLDRIILAAQRAWRVRHALGRPKAHLEPRLKRLTRAWLDARQSELTA